MKDSTVSSTGTRNIKSQDDLEPVNVDVCEERLNNSIHFLRWIVIVFAGLGIFLSFVSRTAISTAMVNIVNQTALYLREHPDTDLSDIAIDEQTGELEWDHLIQSVIINSYFIGYGVPQVTLSQMADKYGVMGPTIISTIASIICTVLFPLSTQFGWGWTTLLRLALGAANAVSYPIAIGLIDMWIPGSENTAAIGLLQAFGLCGYILSPIWSGWICSMAGWIWVFYAIGLLYVLWLILFMLVVTGQPDENKFVSTKELELIMTTRRYQSNQMQRLQVPWGCVFSSWRFWISLISWICLDGATTTFVYLLPTYFRVVMLIDIKKNGEISFIIQSASLIGVMYGSWLTTFFINRLRWSTRKAFITIYFIAAFGSSIFFCLPCFVDQYQIAFFFLVRLLHPALEFPIVGSVLEEYSQYGISGTVFAFYNAVACASTIIFSCTSGYYLDIAQTSVGGKNPFVIVFAGLGALTMLGFFVFTIYGGKPTVPNKGDAFEAPRKGRFDHADSISLDRPVMLRSSSFSQV